jgi:hypothetical protein
MLTAGHCYFDNGSFDRAWVYDYNAENERILVDRLGTWGGLHAQECHGAAPPSGACRS